MAVTSTLMAVSEQTAETVKWVSLGAIALLVIVITLLCVFNRKFSSREVAFAGVCLAASFALSFIKISPVQFGGSITLASFVPLLVYAYKYGFVKGTLAGFILGLFNFISDGYMLTALTFILDYLLAFASIGLMGFAPKFGKLPVTAKVSIGTALVFAVRFAFHLFSGFIYFAENAIWVNLPADNMFLYSFIYQCVYLPADCAICIAVLAALAKTGALGRLLQLMDKPTKKSRTATESETPADDGSEKQ